MYNKLLGWIFQLKISVQLGFVLLSEQTSSVLHNSRSAMSRWIFGCSVPDPALSAAFSETDNKDVVPWEIILFQIWEQSFNKQSPWKYQTAIAHANGRLTIDPSMFVQHYIFV